MRESKGKQLEKQVPGTGEGWTQGSHLDHLPTGGTMATSAHPFPASNPSKSPLRNHAIIDAIPGSRHTTSTIKTPHRRNEEAGFFPPPKGEPKEPSSPPSAAAAPTPFAPVPPATPGGGMEKGEGRRWLVNTRITQRNGRMRSVVACDSGAWTIASWKVESPSKKHLRPFKCRSWRHEGECREWRGAQDFLRCREAIQSRPGWVYAVLTFDPKQWG